MPLNLQNVNKVRSPCIALVETSSLEAAYFINSFLCLLEYSNHWPQRKKKNNKKSAIEIIHFWNACSPIWMAVFLFPPYIFLCVYMKCKNNFLGNNSSGLCNSWDGVSVVLFWYDLFCYINKPFALGFKIKCEVLGVLFTRWKNWKRSRVHLSCLLYRMYLTGLLMKTAQRFNVLTISRAEHLSRQWFVQKICHVSFFHTLKTKSSSMSGIPLLSFLIASVFSFPFMQFQLSSPLF